MARKLVYPELVGTKGLNWKRHGNKGGIGNPRAFAAAQARRPRVAEAHSRGLTIAQIAADLGCSVDVVARDLRALDLAPHDPRIGRARGTPVAPAQPGRRRP
jgi:hypothetical protein